MSRRRSTLMSCGCWQIPQAQPQQRAISLMRQACHLSQSYDTERKTVFFRQINKKEDVRSRGFFQAEGEAFLVVSKKWKQRWHRGKKWCFEACVSFKLTLSNVRVFFFFFFAFFFWKQRLSCTELKPNPVCSLPSKQTSLCITNPNNLGLC